MAFSISCHAQIVVSEGFGLCYPEVYTGRKIINSGLIGYGEQVDVNYQPGKLQFYPGLVVGYGGSGCRYRNPGIISEPYGSTISAVFKESFYFE